MIGFDFTCLYVNETVAKQGQRTKAEFLDRTMMEMYPGIEHTVMFSTLQRCMTERIRDRMESEFAFPNGSTGWFELRFIPVPEGACMLSIDITEQKSAQSALARSEEQLRHAQKMEAVGRLAGGVAHDFNNLLSVILSYTGLMLADLKDGDPLRADLVEVRRAGERAAELTRELLALSRQQVMQPRLISLNGTVSGIERMLARLVGADVEVTVLLAPGLWSVTADPGRIEQAVMNLVANARDAMPKGGKLMIQTGNVDLDDAYARGHAGVTAGPYVVLAVTDTGIGMDEETRARAFEPFFTTKEKGRGTGLGLSTVFGIVKQGGGHIRLDSEPGKGTTFKLYFPRTDGATAPLPAQTAVSPAKRGTETILLVEDDEQVRAATCSILRRSGYTVLETTGAGEALLASEQFGARIDLLLTDVVLPRVGGPELAQRLRETRPAMKILFMSGHADRAIIQDGLLDHGAIFLQKPVTPETLSAKIREALGTSGRWSEPI